MVIVARLEVLLCCEVTIGRLINAFVWVFAYEVSLIVFEGVYLYLSCLVVG